MREKTMRQRSLLFSSIKYWICENGGRIFRRDENDVDKIEEMSEWTDYLNEDKESCEDKEAFRCDVDTAGYNAMIRVRISDDPHSDESVQSKISRIVSSLPDKVKHTFNLGYVDILHRRIGKLAATRWLLNFIDKNNSVRSQCDNDVDFIYMGDDDNDVEIASKAKIALIVKPCSEEMSAFVETRVKNRSDDKRVHNKVITPPDSYRGIPATDWLLNNLLNILSGEEN
jgi:hydroxymethylpyrimidine pyrophosphatase-like HAD family hydrolase